LATEIWGGQIADSETARLYGKAQAAWRESHPQVRWDREENILAFAEALTEQNLVPSSDNLEKVFGELAEQGKLMLSLRVFGERAVDRGRMREILARLMAERKIKNNRIAEKQAAEDALQIAIGELPDAFSNITVLSPEATRLILSPVAQTAQRFDSQSAEEFRKEHAADFRQPAGPIQVKDIRKLFLTVFENHPEVEWSDTAKGTLTQAYEKSGLPLAVQSIEALVSQLKSENRLPLRPDGKIEGQILTAENRAGLVNTSASDVYERMSDAAFRFTVAKMTSNELAERCEADPSFKTRLDSL